MHGMQERIDRVINTKSQLEEFILRFPSVYNNIPDKVKEQIGDDVRTVIQLADYALKEGYLSAEEVASIIDYDNAPLEAVKAYLDSFGIPYPEFPNESFVRSHIHSYENINKINISGQFEWSLPHWLGTEDYKITIQIDDGGVYKQVDPEVYFDFVRQLPDELILRAPDTVTWEVDRVLFVYKKTYEKGIRLLAHNALSLRRMRYTVAGLELWLKLLFNNNIFMNVTTTRRDYPFFRYFTDEGEGTNKQNARYTIFDPRLPGTMDYDGRDLDVENTPRLFGGLQTAAFTNVQIYGMDLNEKVRDFLERKIVDYWIPFPTIFASSFSAQIGDYSCDWLNGKCILPDVRPPIEEGVGFWAVEIDFVIQ